MRSLPLEAAWHAFGARSSDRPTWWGGSMPNGEVMGPSSHTCLEAGHLPTSISVAVAGAGGGVEVGRVSATSAPEGAVCKCGEREREHQQWMQHRFRGRSEAAVPCRAMLQVDTAGPAECASWTGEAMGAVKDALVADSMLPRSSKSWSSQGKSKGLGKPQRWLVPKRLRGESLRVRACAP